MKKLEIIISNSYLRELVNYIEELGIKGYTAIDIVRGKGIRSGEHLSEGLLPFTKKSLIICLVDDSLVDSIFETLSDYLHERHAILYATSITRHTDFGH